MQNREKIAIGAFALFLVLFAGYMYYTSEMQKQEEMLEETQITETKIVSKTNTGIVSTGTGEVVSTGLTMGDIETKKSALLELTKRQEFNGVKQDAKVQVFPKLKEKYELLSKITEADLSKSETKQVLEETGKLISFVEKSLKQIQDLRTQLGDANNGVYYELSGTGSSEQFTKVTNFNFVDLVLNYDFDKQEITFMFEGKGIVVMPERITK